MELIKLKNNNFDIVMGCSKYVEERAPNCFAKFSKDEFQEITFKNTQFWG